jgi:alpha-tubulin suppressor-like RCC1 family protein
MFAMAEPITTIWSAPVVFVRLGAGVVTKIYSTASAFAALKTDGSITAWGNASTGGAGAPVDNGYTKIYSTQSAFVAIKADGSITAWGSSSI